MKELVSRTVMILTLSLWLPSYLFVHAKEQVPVKDGVYQVELSFLSHEAADQEALFSNQAELTVREGTHTLTVSVAHEKLVLSVAAKQQGETLTTSYHTAENLVQFDIKNSQQKFVLTGTYQQSKEHQPEAFSYVLSINLDSLPVEQASLVKEQSLADNEINYQVLTYGTEEHSVMNDYVHPVMKISKEGNRFYAQMEIIKSSWITQLTVEQQGKMVEPKVIAQRGNSKIIQFEVEDFQQKLKLWVEVNLPELTYSYDYFVELAFDQQQAKRFTFEANPATQSQAKSSMPKRAPQLVKPTRPSRVTKPVESDEKDAVVEVAPHPAPEEKLTFDRKLDEEVVDDTTDNVQVASEPTEEELAVSQQDIPVLSLNMLKVAMLFLLCILSGVLLIRRLVIRKKGSVKR